MGTREGRRRATPCPTRLSVGKYLRICEACLSPRSGRSMSRLSVANAHICLAWLALCSVVCAVCECVCLALGKCEIDAQLQFFKLKTVKCNKKLEKKPAEIAKSLHGASSRVASLCGIQNSCTAQQVNGKLDPHIMPQIA